MKIILFNKFIIFISICLVFIFTENASSEYFKVNVKRIEKDLYKDLTSGIYIQTKYCYEYTYGEEAILKWEGNYGDNKLIFDSGTKCDVEKLLDL